jgi:hypothetical protein
MFMAALAHSVRVQIRLFREAQASAAVRMAVKRRMKAIGTHSGTFHCDEALGCYMLQSTKEFAGAQVVRRFVSNEVSTALHCRHTTALMLNVASIELERPKSSNVFVP